MLLHLLRAVGFVCTCLTFVACQTLGEKEDKQEEVDALDRTIDLALDVEVEVQLSARQQLTAFPESIIDVRAEDGTGLKVSDEHLVSTAIAFTLRGTKTGLHRLFVEYEDEDLKKRKETFVVSVEEISHSEVRLRCVDPSADRAVPVGAEFQVGGRAFNKNDDQLDVGGLNLVKEAEGFELVDSEEGTWRAPTTAGRYTWRLLGKNSERLEWIVYDPATSIPNLHVETRQSTERPKVSVDLTPEFEGQPLRACILPTDIHVDIEATEGDCHPAVGDVAFADALSLDLPTGVGNFWAAGIGNCTLRATSPSGTSSEVRLNVDIEPQPFYDWDYAELGQEPAELDLRPEGSVISDRVFRDCPNNSGIFPSGVACPSNFHTDKGCIERTHWKLDYVKLERDIDYVGVGTGLLAEVEVYLRIEHAGAFDDDVYMLPNFLNFSPQTDQLTFADLRCTQDRHIFQITPLEAGEHAIELSAEDTTHGGHTHRVRAFNVARTSLDVMPPLVSVAESLADALDDEEPAMTTPPLPVSVEQTFAASVRHLFVGEQRLFRMGYFDVDRQPLHGIGEITVGSSEPDAGVRVARLPDRSGFGLYVGDDRSLIEVNSPNAPEPHRIYAEDEQGIAVIEGLELAQLEVGDVYCVELYPLAEDGLLIEGRAPSPPVVKGTRPVFRAFEQDSKTCFIAHTQGTVDLEWKWGNAEKTLSWFAN